MKYILAFAVLTVRFSTLLAAQEVDREKLQDLHRSGKALEEALANPASTSPQLRELCRKVDLEAQKVEHGLATKEEKYIYDLYSTASAEYLASLQRFEKHRSQARLEVDLMPVKEYLRIADDTFNGRPHETGPSSPAAPPAPVPAPPKPPPPAPPPRVEPAAPPAPSPASAPEISPPAPAPVPPSVSAPPVVSAPPAAPAPSPSSVAPEPPPPAPISPPPAPPATRTAAPDLSRPKATPHPRPIDDANPTAIRKAADKVKVEKKEDAVRPCELVGEISIPGKSVSGVYAIEGHNYYYGSGLELARFKTVEVGGDTIYLRSSTRTALEASAYRCAEFR